MKSLHEKIKSINLEIQALEQKKAIMLELPEYNFYIVLDNLSQEWEWSIYGTETIWIDASLSIPVSSYNSQELIAILSALEARLGCEFDSVTSPEGDCRSFSASLQYPKFEITVYVRARLMADSSCQKIIKGYRKIHKYELVEIEEPIVEVLCKEEPIV